MDIPLPSKTFLADENLVLRDQPTKIDPVYKSDEHYEALLAKFREDLRVRQEVLYAQARWSVLVIFQGMDASGKDGAISHVMSGLNPQGCIVSSFKQPSAEDAAHDFLWRAVVRLPSRGGIGIFNRSYYEEVLVPRVHESVLEESRLPEELIAERKSLWKHRLKDIRHFESYLARNGTKTLKFFLNVSKKEQTSRLRDRLTEKDKQWKVQPSDFRERGYWKEYMKCYEDFLRHTSTEESPWYVIPGDDKKNARLLIGRLVTETMQALPLRYPKPSAEQKRFIKEMLESEK